MVINVIMLFFDNRKGINKIMIKINLQSTKETFEIGDKEFTADFSDTNVKEYFELTKEFYEKGINMEKKYAGLEKEKDPNKLINTLVQLIPEQANEFKNLFDRIFGEGKGEEIYKLCGESTPNMKLVFEVVWGTVLDRMKNVESEGQKTVDKYVHNDNKKKNK